MQNLLQHVRSPLSLLAMLWFLLAGSPAIAQPDVEAASQDGGQQAEQADPEGDVPVTDQPGGIQAANESVEGDSGDGDAEEEEEEGASRFIPSEQISQDLGVSFPADI